jgi:hypothetical protein
MSNREKVAAIRQAWRDVLPEDLTIIASGSGLPVDLDLYAQIAINVLTDWHKRDLFNLND